MKVMYFSKRGNCCADVTTRSSSMKDWNCIICGDQYKHEAFGNTSCMSSMRSSCLWDSNSAEYVCSYRLRHLRPQYGPSPIDRRLSLQNLLSHDHADLVDKMQFCFSCELWLRLKLKSPNDRYSINAPSFELAHLWTVPGAYSRNNSPTDASD